MSNVFELFKQKKIEDPSGPKTIVTITVVDILASSAQLARTVKELSMHFEAVDRVIDAINDTDTRNRGDKVPSGMRLEFGVAHSPVT
jgi:hypothetical protein